ncbi:MAG TPA: VOC family protein [Dehalococcoidia bacterium]|nr:VOC family protein [Dehalococcoidia bacterium]
MPRVTGLGHVGLFVRDPAVMVDFYSNFLGMQVTDRGEDDRIVFLSARPEQEHHELALAKAPDRTSEVQQISFTVGSLADLRAFWRQINERGYPVDRVVNHGIAFGCYFRDPEGNRVEVYWPTGKDYPQPHGDPIDLDQSEAELLALLDAMPPKARTPSPA